MITVLLLRLCSVLANGLPMLITEDTEGFPMILTELFLLWGHTLPESLHYAGQRLIWSEIPKLVSALAHRAPWEVVLPSLVSLRLPVLCSDATLAEAVATVQAQGLCQKLQADGAGQLLL